VSRLVLGLDPSIKATGWALIAGDALVGLGSWATQIDSDAGKFADRARRAEEIGRALLALVTEHRPSRAFIEAPIFKPSDGKMSVHAAARVRGVAEGICLACGIPLVEFSPQDVKRAITNDPHASKEQVARRLHQLYERDLRIGNADDNATDALAVAYVGVHRVATTVSSGVVSYRPVEEEEFEVL